MLGRGPLLRNVSFLSQTSFVMNESTPRWMSKEPAEIFERAADDGFVAQVRICMK